MIHIASFKGSAIHHTSVLVSLSTLEELGVTLGVSVRETLLQKLGAVYREGYLLARFSQLGICLTVVL